MSEERFTYFKVPLGFGKQAIKDNADEVFDFTLSNVLDNKDKKIISLIRTNKNLKEENEKLREDRKVANDFIVKKGLDIEYYKYWRGLQNE